MACTSFLQGFTTSCGSNLASIKKIWVGAFESATFTYNYQEAPDGSTYPLVDADGYVLDQDGNKIIESVASATLVADIDLITEGNQPGQPWVEFGFRKNSSEMTSEMTRSDNGSYYFTNAANLVFAKQDQVKRLALQATASGECAMVILDSNGKYWLIGSENPVTATTLSATTGTAVGDANQYTITLSADEAYMPIPLDAEQASTIITALTGSASN